MLKTLSRVLAFCVLLTLWSAGCQMTAKAPQIPGITPQMSTALAKHPASQALVRLFPDKAAPVPGDFQPTGIKREDYLSLVAGNVDFFKQHQNAAGAIIDPIKHEEIQYSTPAFALAAATLVQQKHRDDLLEPALRAMTFATHAIPAKTTANFHADFYIPMLIHARRILAPRASKALVEKWDADFRAIIPEAHYNDHDARANWNIVNVSGESLRRKDGLVATTQATTQQAYIERSLDKQQARYTKFGMYTDPNMPLAYDAFPRLWLEEMMAEGAYAGEHAQQIRDFLMLGGLSSLLIISPTGEWAAGGRSAQHQWNEAENVVIFEINARKWHALGRDDIAGAMKRSAHLAFQSMKRWQRPSGEMWIVKNRAEPETRLGFEGYSSHSQYNLLPTAMLCRAFARADDSIAERPAPCETGGFVFDLREKFHKVIANSGGMYVEIDTGADAEYNATGLQRVQRKGVALSPLSDSTAARRHYGPDAAPKAAMSPGIQWKSAGSTVWKSLADFVSAAEPKPARGETPVRSVDLNVLREQSDAVVFSIRYHLGTGETIVEEKYSVEPEVVMGNWRIEGESTANAEARVLFPVLVNDGARDLGVNTSGRTLQSHREGGVLRWEASREGSDFKLHLEEQRIPCHNGWMSPIVGELPPGRSDLRWRLTLENEK